MTASEDAAVSNAGDRISQSLDGRRFQNISIWTISCAARCDPERTMQMKDEVGAPKIVDRRTFQAELDALRVREKAHTREGDAIAAARRRLSGRRVGMMHIVCYLRQKSNVFET